MYASKKHCRWCGKEYYATKPPNQDGFCRPAHKQAHYRAYRAYVTETRLAPGHNIKPPVTRKRNKMKRSRKARETQH